MALIPGQRGHDIGTGIARAMMMLGAMGKPRMQAGLLNQFQQEAERKRMQNQFGGLLEDMDISPQQRGILSMLPPHEGAGILAQQAFAQPEQTSLMRNLGAMGLQPGTPEYTKAMRGILMKPQVQIQNAPDLPKNYMARDPKDLSQGVVPIPGGPADPSSPSRKRPVNEASAIAAARNSKQELQEARSRLFSATGELNRGEVASAALPLTSGRTTRQKVRRSIESVIRAQSGAAVPPSEIERYMELYYPSPLDTDKGAKAKMDALERFIDGLLSGLSAEDAQAAADGQLGPSQEDLEFTAKKHGITVEEVKRRLNAQRPAGQ